MSPREVIQMLYTPQNMYEILRYICSSSHELAKAVHSLCKPYGIPFPEPPQELFETEIEGSGCDFKLEKAYPIGYRIVCSEPYRWRSFITVSPSEFECYADVACKSLAWLRYHLDSYDRLIDLVQRYDDWLRDQVELLNKQVDEICENRLKSENHRLFLELLERARVFNSVDTD